MKIINLYRLIPAYLIFVLQPRGVKKLICADLECWNQYSQINSSSYFQILSALLVEFKEFRNLFICRLSGGELKLLFKIMFKFLFKSLDSLYIQCPKIGPRLYIQHGFFYNCVCSIYWK